MFFKIAQIQVFQSFSRGTQNATCQLPPDAAWSLKAIWISLMVLNDGPWWTLLLYLAMRFSLTGQYVLAGPELGHQCGNLSGRILVQILLEIFLGGGANAYTRTPGFCECGVRGIGRDGLPDGLLHPLNIDIETLNNLHMCNFEKHGITYFSLVFTQHGHFVKII